MVLGGFFLVGLSLDIEQECWIEEWISRGKCLYFYNRILGVVCTFTIPLETLSVPYNCMCIKRTGPKDGAPSQSPSIIFALNSDATSCRSKRTKIYISAFSNRCQWPDILGGYRASWTPNQIK